MAMAMFGQPKKVVATRVVAADGSGDYVDIQEAIDSLPAGGGVVYVKEGTYTITTVITINKSNVALIGAGKATSIFLAEDSDCDCINLGDNATTRTGILIADLSIDGNRDNNAGTLYGIELLGKVDDSKISGCWITECDTTGIKFTGNNNRNIITENTVTSCDNIGIDIQDSTDPNIVSDNTCSSMGTHGIQAIATTGSIYIIGNVCTGNTEHGIACSTNDAVISNNMCLSNTKDGVYLTSSVRNTINGNCCKLNGEHGIEIRSSSQNVITANTYTKNSQTTTNTYDGIRLSLTCEYNTITANTIYRGGFGNIHKYGINEEAAAANYNIILGNCIYLSGSTANTRVQGANTILQHNNP